MSNVKNNDIFPKNHDPENRKSAKLSEDLAALLAESLKGESEFSSQTRALYATDASPYEYFPAGVLFPKDTADIQKIVAFASEHRLGLIPRGAGTSLAGQVVGEGLVLDCTRHFNQILDFDPTAKTLWVEPGVVRDKINRFLKPSGLLFGPETSTSDRCVMGGMVGNNASGAHSLVFGTTRDKVLRIEAVLASGEVATFGPVETLAEYRQLEEGTTAEAAIYRHFHSLFVQSELMEEALKTFPRPSIKRRNSGYALDLVHARWQQLQRGEGSFSLVPLLCGSEGTLIFITKMQLALDTFLPPHQALLALHCQSLEQAARATVVAMKFAPSSVELIDDIILKYAGQNSQQKENLSFVEGVPKAIVGIELSQGTEEELTKKMSALVGELRQQKLGFHFPVLKGKESAKLNDVRKAGLGIVQNRQDDLFPVTVIEDTAVSVEDLPAYVQEMEQLFEREKLSCVFYGHAGAGELHLRPLLNLKLASDREVFTRLAIEVADLIKKYRGSLSGEHGDGILRGQLLGRVFGEEVIGLFNQVKAVFDPLNIFNPGKIVHPLPFNQRFRDPEISTTVGDGIANTSASTSTSTSTSISISIERQLKPMFHYPNASGPLWGSEKCKGVGSCLKSPEEKGAMCPSYHGEKREENSTRGRANAIRQYLRQTHPVRGNEQERTMQAVLKTCLSCKSCLRECPSSVDISQLKAEVLHFQHQRYGIPLTTLMVGFLPRLLAFSSHFSPIKYLLNFTLSHRWTKHWVAKILGQTDQRPFPLLARSSFYQTYQNYRKASAFSANASSSSKSSKVFLFVDEFTNFYEPEIARDCLRVFEAFGIEVAILPYSECGRTLFSQGLLKQARAIAEGNVERYAPVISEKTPLIFLEPSGLSAFLDEYPKILAGDKAEQARSLAKHVWLAEDYLGDLIQKMDEAKQASLQKLFNQTPRHIFYHRHCHLQALRPHGLGAKALSLPLGSTVVSAPEGCCGMAGNFGFEASNYQLSIKIAEAKFFPALKKFQHQQKDHLIYSSQGTSCRQQMRDGMSVKGLHPMTVLAEALL